MNTFAKYVPNVWLAKCEEEYKKWDVIMVANKYWDEKEYTIHNLVVENKNWKFYSVTRTDWFNIQEYAKQKAERYAKWGNSSIAKSDSYWKASQEWRDFLALAEPIKVWHHSEKKHRALIERNSKRMDKSMELNNKASEQLDRAEYWSTQENKINLSMPESIEYYEHKVEQARVKHEWLKNGTIEKSHSYSLTYAKKELNEATKNLEIAIKLWQ